MRKVLFTLLAAAISLSACRKQQNSMPLNVATEMITDADFNDSKAVQTGHFKKNDDGLELDYSLVLKEVSPNKYMAAVKINGLSLNGKDVKESKDDAYSAIVIAINNTKKDPANPDIATLITDENRTPETDKWPVVTLSADMKQVEKGRVYTFPAFTCKDDLEYEVLDLQMSVAHESPIFISPIGVQQNVLMMSSVGITVPNTTIQILSGNFEIKENAQMPVNGSNTTIGFQMAISTKGIPTLTDREEYFVLPTGHTVTQNPEVASLKLDGKDGYMTIVISGDPAREVKTVSYQPPAVPANNPKDPKEMITFPVMKFELTHFNQKNGVQRFRSTEKWSKLYKVGPGESINGITMANISRAYSKVGT